jgi:3-hydroxymyristoyl/3-hydroxydecanoyl-(acyl carrier protein) dehydratase
MVDGATGAESVLTSSFTFPAEFIGFQGHFPTNKVLPGACQIQCVLSTIEKALQKRVVLKEIILAKYVAPVLPGENIKCTLSGGLDSDAGFIYKASITKGMERVAELKLSVSLVS